MGLKRGWALELCEITEKKGVPRICMRRMLMLPAVQPDTHIILEKFDETSSVTGRPSALRCPPAPPFRDPPSDSVLAFYVGASSRSGEKQKLLFSVFTSTLRSFTMTIKRTTRFRWRKRDIRPFIVPWNEWGPELTRWIDVGDIPMVRALSGARCVISERSTGRVRMLDFNPERLHWIDNWIKRKAGETEGRDWRMGTSPTTILAGEVFKYGIVSKLPYYEVRKTGVGVEADFTFLIDDKWFVLIRVCSKQYNVANIRLISNIFSYNKPGRRPDLIDGESYSSTVHSVLASGSGT